VVEEGAMDLGFLFPYLLFLHVLGAIVAFGPSFSFSIIGAMGSKEPPHGNFAIRVSEAISHRLVYPIGITLPITGAAMLLVRGINPLDRASWWLALAIVLYVIAYGYSYFFQSKLVARVIEITSTPPPPGASGPPPELPPIVARIQRGGMMLGILLVAIVFLMVVKPTI
jgi:uncharacterized membrane protein